MILNGYVVRVCGETGHIDVAFDVYVAIGTPSMSPGIPSNPVVDSRSCVPPVTDQSDAMIKD